MRAKARTIDWVLEPLTEAPGREAMYLVEELLRGRRKLEAALASSDWATSIAEVLRIANLNRRGREYASLVLVLLIDYVPAGQKRPFYEAFLDRVEEARRALDDERAQRFIETASVLATFAPGDLDEKNVDRLVSAVAAYPDALRTLVGRGVIPSAEAIEALRQRYAPPGWRVEYQVMMRRLADQWDAARIARALATTRQSATIHASRTMGGL
jgi:hypothetical protein